MTKPMRRATTTVDSEDQVIADVHADTVNISGGGAQNVSAREVTITQGGAMRVRGHNGSDRAGRRVPRPGP